METIKGKILQVLGAVVDVEFPDRKLPMVKDALTVELDGRTRVMEVAQHMGGMVNSQQPEMPQNVPAMGQYAIDQNQAAAIYQAMYGQQMQQQQKMLL